MGALKGFLIIMGVLAVIAIMALIVGYVLALLTPDIRSNMRPVVLSSEAVDSLNKKMDNFKKEAIANNANKIPKNIELQVTEEEANSFIVMTLAEGTLPAREMLVNFNDGYLLAYSAWNFPWFPTRTGIMGSVDVEGGKPKFIVRDFFLGKLPLPDPVDKGVEDLSNIIIKLNAPLEELKLDIVEVTISEGQIRLLATARGGKQ
jgi:hypothetical protein